MLAADGRHALVTTAAGIAVLDVDRGTTTIVPGTAGAARLTVAANGRRAAAFVDGRLLMWPLDRASAPRQLGRLPATPTPSGLALGPDALMVVYPTRVVRWPAATPSVAAVRGWLDRLGPP